jgi:hypothetical protein
VDVDGVLNAFRAVHSTPYLRTAEANGYPITFNPRWGADLLALAARTKAELVWCTTWQDLANEHIAPLVGLPQLPYIPLTMPKMSASVGMTKAFSIARWHEAHGALPFIWFEDEMDAALHASVYLPDVDHEVVWVSPQTGLTPAHFEQAHNALHRITPIERVPDEAV